MLQAVQTALKMLYWSLLMYAYEEVRPLTLQRFSTARRKLQLHAAACTMSAPAAFSPVRRPNHATSTHAGPMSSVGCSGAAACGSSCISVPHALQTPDSSYRLETAMDLHSLTDFEMIWEPAMDTKCLMAWNPTTHVAVLAFRGTASMANVFADLQASPIRQLNVRIAHVLCARRWFDVVTSICQPSAPHLHMIRA